MRIFARSIYCMANLTQQFEELENKMAGIIIRLRDYQQINNSLQQQNKELLCRIEAMGNEQENQKKQQQMLSITQTLLQKEDTTEIKKEINRLVREIDYCISYINSK